ncbi:MAG: FmdB family zinc ribbon protein [bacterium]
MAIYKYKCSDCGNIFDIQATIQEKEAGNGEKFICPKCQSKNIKSKVSVANFVKNICKGEDSCGCSGDKGCGCCK